jgi:hypothetical protein
MLSLWAVWIGCIGIQILRIHCTLQSILIAFSPLTAGPVLIASNSRQYPRYIVAFQFYRYWMSYILILVK